MIDPNDTLDVQVEKQAKIIDALISRVSHQHEFGGSAYALFQSAVSLQNKVSEKTRDLEAALDTLGQASHRLEFSEEARAQTQRTLSDALETMDGGFALFAEGKLQAYNEFFKKLIPDIADSILVGLEIADYIEAIKSSSSIKPHDRSDYATLAPSVMRPDTGKTAPFIFALKNDRWFVISSRQTRSNNIVILQTEITTVVRKNRIEKTQLINEQEDFLQATFDNMPQGVGTFSAEGTLLIANGRFSELLTLPIQLASVGTSFGQMAEFLAGHALVGTIIRSNFESLIRYLRRHKTLKLRVRHVNKTMLTLDMHPLPDGGCIVNVVDVTAETQTTEMLEARVEERTAELMEVNARLVDQHKDQARVEEDLRIAKTKVEEAMTSKTKFFAAASHDLLQPVNAAKLLISTLLEQTDGSQAGEVASRLNGSFRSIEGLLHALLDIARLEAVDTNLVPAPFPLDTILSGITVDFGVLADEKGIDLRTVGSDAWVLSDQRYLSRSVRNLVDNAIQYTETGRVLVGARHKAGSVVVEVWDTGVGITKADQTRIFKEFTRIQNSRASGHGMGLGLSIVERACRHLGHPVSLRSKPGIGSVFSIEVPTVAPLFGDAHREEKEERPSTAAMDLIVLMIENDLGVSFAMTQKLESWGASVLATQSTQEALEVVNDLGMAPDIILADYQLNGNDNGVTSIRELRAKLGQDVPAIMITANHEKRIKTAGMENKFSVLTKPVQLSRLRSLMEWKVRSPVDYGHFE